MSDRRAHWTDDLIEAVKDAMHEMHDCDIHGGGECGQHGICRWCNAPWPCPTIRAIEGEL